MQAAVLVMIFHFLGGDDLTIISWDFPDEYSCLEAQQDDAIQVPEGTTVTTQCVVSTEEDL